MRMENNGIKLWIPSNSSQRRNTDWLWENYPPDLRFSSMIFVSEDNVLHPDVIRAMYNVHKRIEAIVTEDGLTWSDMCMEAPIVKAPSITTLLGFDFRRKKRQTRVELNSESNFFEGFDDDDDPFFEDEGGRVFWWSHDGLQKTFHFT